MSINSIGNVDSSTIVISSAIAGGVTAATFAKLIFKINSDPWTDYNIGGLGYVAEKIAEDCIVVSSWIIGTIAGAWAGALYVKGRET